MSYYKRPFGVYVHPAAGFVEIVLLDANQRVVAKGCFDDVLNSEHDKKISRLFRLFARAE